MTRSLPVASFITRFCTRASDITLSRKRDGKYLIIYDEVDACRVIYNAILYQFFRYNAEPMAEPQEGSKVPHYM